MRRNVVWSMAMVAILAGCDCTGGLQGSDGVPEVDRVVIDFGRVRINENKRAELTIVNRGSATLGITGFDRSSAPVVFRAGDPPASLGTNATAQVTFIFAPDEVGPFEGKVVLLTDSETRPEVEIELKGEGVRTMVEIAPQTVDFGVVAVDGRELRTITLTNTGAIAEEVTVLTLADGSPHFSGGPIPGGSDVVRLEPGASAEIPVSFSPRFADPGGFVSSATFLPCPTCATATVTLRGVGVDSFLTVSPAAPTCLDFGIVNPGASLTRELVLGNVGARSLDVLTGEISAGGSLFSLGRAFPATLEGESQLVVPVTYTPDAATNHQGTVTFTSTDPKAPQVEVCLRGSGGGPDVSVSPPSINFGSVAMGAPRSRRVAIANVGLAPVSGVATPLLVSRVSVRNGTQTGYSVEFEPATLAPGATTFVTVTFDPLADGEANDVLEVETNDVDSPVVEVPLTGVGRDLPPCELELVPASGTLAFGNVDRGRVAQLPLALRNIGAGACLVEDLALSPTSNPAFSLPSQPPAQVELAAGELLAVTVQFHPRVHASYAGEVRFVVSDPAAPNRSVALSGISTEGCLLVTPREIDFGTTGALCTTGERTIDVYNVCTTPIALEGIRLNDAPEEAFVLSTSGVTLPKTLDGSASIRVRVRYRPPANGDHVGAVFVESDERAEAYLVSLTGKSRPDPIQVDNFNQDQRPIDILFVIDNSGSMEPYQQSLAANLDSFMQFANRALVDYRIAVTTTDVTPNFSGRFVPLTMSGTWPAAGATPPRVLRRSTPEVMRAFRTNVAVGTGGSGTEAGIEAAYQALQPSMLAGHNAGFLRDDASLSVILVSDEPDQSPLDLNFYYGYFLNIKGARAANLFSFSSICQADDPAGERYVELARRTGGVVSSIRTSSWATDLEKLGLIAFGYKSRFFLTTTPDPATIEVFFDGAPMPPADEEAVNWIYDAEANLVEFRSHAIPEPGQEVEVRYRVICGGP